MAERRYSVSALVINKGAKIAFTFELQEPNKQNSKSRSENQVKVS